MKFYKDLYLGESVKNPSMVKWKLKVNAGQLGVYIIALCKGLDQLEIYHCAYLQQKYYRRNPPYIIGLAGSYEEAVDIVKKIAEESFAQSQNCDLKNYLLQKIKTG